MVDCRTIGVLQQQPKQNLSDANSVLISLSYYFIDLIITNSGQKLYYSLTIMKETLI